MKTSLITVILIIIYPLLTQAQSSKTHERESQDNQINKPPFKRYEDIIMTGAVTQEGLFKFHQVDENYYFELPQSILGKDILIVSKISGIPHQFSPIGSGAYTRQEEHQVIRFQKKNSKILMKLISFDDMAEKESPIQQSIKSNNFQPIIYAFDIEALSPKQNSYVISIKDFFTSDIPLIGVKGSEIYGLDRSRCIINKVRVFDTNIEVRHILTYRVSERPYSDRNNSLSFELNQSFVLLPEVPMPCRLHDERVHFFSINRTNYSLDNQKAVKKKYITRWRLEPSDWTAFNKSRLVEPIKPIVYYVDPGTPEEWKPYIKQGVKDWQAVFEAIGFKNAIQVKDPPENDPDWDIHNFQYSVIRYIPTESGTAVGFTINDPRTGEILKADIHFGHGFLKYIKKLFFIQTAGANPDARTLNFKDEVMGELIRSVIAHEVGHTLGLQHIMTANSAYAVDSLRSPTFTNTHGLSSSIMDYAWGNYIAQPEDSVINFYTKIGEYDYWAIEYGYRPINQNISPEREKIILNQWVKERINHLVYRPIGGVQGEMDLGDDPIKACTLGISNLKRIAENLIDWTTEPGEDYTDLSNMHNELYEQFYRCLEPVVKMVGGKRYRWKTADEKGPMYQFIPENKQRKAIETINEYVFRTPTWLRNLEVQQRVISGLSLKGGVNQIKKLHEKVLNALMRGPINMMEDEAFNGENAYTLAELYNDLRNEIFSELKTNKKIDIYRRNLQKLMIGQLDKGVNIKQELYKNTDVSSIALASLMILSSEIEENLILQKDIMSKYHLQDLLIRINRILHTK